jgi:hypothetical protein
VGAEPIWARDPVFPLDWRHIPHSSDGLAPGFLCSLKSWFEIENSRWQEIFSSPQTSDETLSKCLDADKQVFSPRLNHLQMNALQSARNSDSFRLQQLYQSIRNLEASVAKKRRALGVQREARLVSGLIRSPKPRTIQLAVKIATAVESRSLRELQSLLFRLTRQYRTLHKRYSQIYEFSSYARNPLGGDA